MTDLHELSVCEPRMWWSCMLGLPAAWLILLSVVLGLGAILAHHGLGNVVLGGPTSRELEAVAALPRQRDNVQGRAVVAHGVVAQDFVACLAVAKAAVVHFLFWGVLTLLSGGFRVECDLTCLIMSG
ncbi:hypothetical protein EV126DRAFT_429715 [Verticillium dahliae]|nr:hypothetical protein EV126DRAFT_429715 [Verticillium dahliae]